MKRDDLIIACFCLIDDLLPQVVEGKRLRERGFAPRLSDSEVITMEIVGTYLGYNQDKALFEYFQFHWNHFFPGLLEWTAAPLCGKPPICGRSRSASGA